MAKKVTRTAEVMIIVINLQLTKQSCNASYNDQIHTCDLSTKNVDPVQVFYVLQT